MIGQGMTGKNSQKPQVKSENSEVLCENKIFKETLYTIGRTVLNTFWCSKNVI